MIRMDEQEEQFWKLVRKARNHCGGDKPEDKNVILEGLKKAQNYFDEHLLPREDFPADFGILLIDARDIVIDGEEHEDRIKADDVLRDIINGMAVRDVEKRMK